jgi:digeranylgeranylglycerophospholipid reductase
MQHAYDCIVIGGGPGGAWTAKHAAENGATVLLLEKDREVGLPVRCGEAVGREGLQEVLGTEPESRWIANTIDGVILVAPDGREVVVDARQCGYILDRRIFDYDLVRIASEKGVEVVTKAYVFDILQNNGAAQGVRLQHLGQTHEVAAAVVIGADGVESRVGRWAGLRTNIKMRDMESCMQLTLSNIKVDRRYIYFYFGKNIAPGGYLWVFPKGDTSANVGIGISGEFSRFKSAQKYLMEFVTRTFPGAAILYTVVGGVPCAATLKQITRDGLMLVGDAARQVNPMSGGGIITAMLAGKIAGCIAASAVSDGDVSDKRLSAYARAWHKQQGRSHQRFYQIKQAVYKLSDADLNRTADSVLAYAPEKRTLVNIFKTALVKHPGLLLDVVRLFIQK